MGHPVYFEIVSLSTHIAVHRYIDTDIPVINKIFFISVDYYRKHSFFYLKGMSQYDIPVEWYRQLKDIPNAFSLIIAHEFFDALPIHKFHKTYTGYKEVLIDIDPNSPKNENVHSKFR